MFFDTVHYAIITNIISYAIYTVQYRIIPIFNLVEFFTPTCKQHVEIYYNPTP